MSRFVLTPKAKADLRQIINHIASENLPAAKRVRIKKNEVMHCLSRSPGIGHLRRDLSDAEVRFHQVYSYLILYRPETKPLQIVRILHAARDVETILDNPLE